MNGNTKIKKKNGRGYTLIELLVVIALIGILSAICVPNFTFIGQSNEEKELKTFKRDIYDIKNKAIMEGQTYYLEIVESDNSYSIYTHSKIEPVTDLVLVKKVQFESLKLAIGSNATKSMSFNATGSPGAGDSILLKDKKGNLTKITVAPVTGKIRVYKI